MLISFKYALTSILIGLFALFYLFLINYTLKLKSVLERLKTLNFDIWGKTGHLLLTYKNYPVVSWIVFFIKIVRNKSKCFTLFFMVSEMSDIIFFYVRILSYFLYSFLRSRKSRNTF